MNTISIINYGDIKHPVNYQKNLQDIKKNRIYKILLFKTKYAKLLRCHLNRFILLEIID